MITKYFSIKTYGFFLGQDCPQTKYVKMVYIGDVLVRYHIVTYSRRYLYDDRPQHIAQHMLNGRVGFMFGAFTPEFSAAVAGMQYPDYMSLFDDRYIGESILDNTAPLNKLLDMHPVIHTETVSVFGSMSARAVSRWGDIAIKTVA